MRLSNDNFANPFERLESPFLEEALLFPEPNAELVSSHLEHAWTAEEGVPEVELEEPQGSPSTPIDFPEGRLWTFTASTLPVRVSIFCPKSLNPQKPMDMLFYAHGDQGGCAPIPKAMPEDLVTKAPFELKKIVHASNRRIALVVPHMDWNNLKKNKLGFEACNNPNASLHALGIPANLNGVLKEVLAEIGRVFGTPAPSVENLILAGHSRAHGFFNTLALLHIDPEMRKGVLATLKEVWCLDTTYFCYMAEWFRWLRSGSNLTMSVFYRLNSGTAAFGRKFQAAVGSFGGGKLMVTVAREGHCAVPTKRLPELLSRKAHYVASEITDEVETGDEAAALDEWSDAFSEHELEARGPEASEESAEEILGEAEVIDPDERTLVTDTLKVPNRWICAIDILTDNPKWGSHGQPKFLIKSRATGTLIGSRYVLTAAHILGTLDAKDAMIDVKGLTVSPARNGSNSTNPLGKVKAKAVRVSQRYQIRRTITQGPSKGTQVSIPRRDDYALLILEKDLAGSTHAKMKGALGYWGSSPAVAVVKRMEPADLNDKEIVVIGYPGDTCGKDKWSGSKAQKKVKVDDCWNRRNDEWASTQWRSAGTLQVDPDLRRLFHTADTYEGQSGAPVCLSVDGTLHLVGIHTAGDTAVRNQGVRVTRRMLQELCAWINADAGSQVAAIQNDTLVLQPSGGGATAKELLEAEEQEDFNEEAFDQEDDEDYVGVESEEFEGDLSREWSHLTLEERFDPTAVPADVAAARDKQDWPLTLKLAIAGGIRNENDLTSLLFFARHPELPAEPLKKEHPNYEKLKTEWKEILRIEVKPAIVAATTNTSLKVSSKYVLERDPMFSGASGAKFKALVEEVAKDADINPGLLAAVLLAEWDKRSLYLSPGEVKSFVSGTDDFYVMRDQLKDNVPAFARVRFNATTTTNRNEHGRIVTTVTFKTGKDAALATAVYLKYAEIKLRKAAEKNGGDFDKFAVETRFALVRVAMAAGHGGIKPDGEFTWFRKKGTKWVVTKKGEKGAVLRGVAPRLDLVLKGGDFLVRKDETRKNPTRSAHITNRNATILVAQAFHLSDWMFGLPLNAGVQPELEWFEGGETDETAGFEAWLDEEYEALDPFGETEDRHVRAG